MKKVSLILTALFIYCLVSCSTSKTIISDSAKLENYKYASLTDVMNYNGSASLMDIEVQIYDAIESTRLEMIGDKMISDLSSTQKEQLLLVRFSASQDDDKSIVSVNFVDYRTGKPVASCKGAWGGGWGRNRDLKGAIDRVSKQIKNLFPVTSDQ